MQMTGSPFGGPYHVDASVGITGADFIVPTGFALADAICARLDTDEFAAGLRLIVTPQRRLDSLVRPGPNDGIIICGHHLFVELNRPDSDSGSSHERVVMRSHSSPAFDIPEDNIVFSPYENRREVRGADEEWRSAAPEIHHS